MPGIHKSQDHKFQFYQSQKSSYFILSTKKLIPQSPQRVTLDVPGKLLNQTQTVSTVIAKMRLLLVKMMMVSMMTMMVAMMVMMVAMMTMMVAMMVMREV